jgi:hypothetical protein
MLDSEAERSSIFNLSSVRTEDFTEATRVIGDFRELTVRMRTFNAIAERFLLERGRDPSVPQPRTRKAARANAQDQPISFKPKMLRAILIELGKLFLACFAIH